MWQPLRVARPAEDDRPDPPAQALHELVLIDVVAEDAHSHALEDRAQDHAGVRPIVPRGLLEHDEVGVLRAPLNVARSATVREDDELPPELLCADLLQRRQFIRDRLAPEPDQLGIQRRVPLHRERHIIERLPESRLPMPLLEPCSELGQTDRALAPLRVRVVDEEPVIPAPRRELDHLGQPLTPALLPPARCVPVVVLEARVEAPRIRVVPQRRAVRIELQPLGGVGGRLRAKADVPVVVPVVVELPEPRPPLQVPVHRHPADVRRHPTHSGLVQALHHFLEAGNPVGHIFRRQPLDVLAESVRLVLSAQRLHRAPTVVQRHILPQVQEPRRGLRNARDVALVPQVLRAVVQHIRERQRSRPSPSPTPLVGIAHIAPTIRLHRRLRGSEVPRRLGRVFVVGPVPREQRRPLGLRRQERRQVPPEFDIHVVQIHPCRLGLRYLDGPRPPIHSLRHHHLHLGPVIEVAILFCRHIPLRVSHPVVQPLTRHARVNPHIEVLRPLGNMEVERPPRAYGLQRRIDTAPVGMG